MATMNFNSEQLEFINCKQSALVFASAGTGKTFAITKKIENSLKSNETTSDRILCLTFTNRGCNEMLDRITKGISKDYTDKLTIKTFHSFCYELISVYNTVHRDGAYSTTIFDENDTLLVCKHLCENHTFPISGKNTNPEEALNIIVSYFKQELIKKSLFNNKYDFNYIVDLLYKNPDFLNKEIRSLIYKFEGNFTYIISKNELISILNDYQFELNLSHAFDFNDLEYFAGYCLLDNEYLKLLVDKYDYIYIDEAQDTSFHEYSLIKKFYGKAKVYLCGDFFQTIYEWRGSNPSIIQKDFISSKNAVSIVFTDNFRSTQNITNASFSILENMYGVSLNQIRKFKSASNEEGEKIKITSCSNIYYEAISIDKEISRRVANGDYNSCILCRTNSYAKDISWFLRESDRYFLVQDYQYYKRPEVKEILSFLRLIVNPYDNVALERIALKYIKGFGEVRLSKMMSNTSFDLGNRLSDLFDAKVHQYEGDLYGLLKERLRNNDVVVFDTETTGVDPNSDEIIQIACVRINSNFEEIERFETIVKANKKVGDSFFVHGISDEQIQKEGIDKFTALTDFLDFVGDSLIIGHNVKFDIDIVNSELERSGFNPRHFNFYDTYLMAKRFIKGQENFKLETLSKSLKLDFVSSHDALDDVFASASLLKYMFVNYIVPLEARRLSFIKPFLKPFKIMANNLEACRKGIYKCSFTTYIEKVVDLLNMHKIYEKSENAIFNIDHFIKLAKVINDSTKSSYCSLKNLLTVSSLSSNDFDAIFKEKKLIPIITVHQSKGCEFNNVYLTGLADDNFPSFMAKQQGYYQEELRLFYVAVTRAKKTLFITYPRLKTVGEYTFACKKSPFIEYLNKKYIEEF